MKKPLEILAFNALNLDFTSGMIACFENNSSHEVIFEKYLRIGLFNHSVKFSLDITMGSKYFHILDHEYSSDEKGLRTIRY